ncbi:hypothetical protein [Flaviaesturariibacter amylovorans]|uniref:DUF202 domain-containing protein n=1 Tax=Flaviaesturariibacter amylovorans TaxID=1084520 RepID=A0ABP8H3F7_9BACT
MLTSEEQAFVDFWTGQRTRRRSVASRISSGLPLGVGIVVVLFLSIATGWYQRATMVMRTHSSVILMIVIAAIGIVLFMSYFSAQHEWDQNEERYQVLLQKQKSAGAAKEL